MASQIARNHPVLWIVALLFVSVLIAFYLNVSFVSEEAAFNALLDRIRSNEKYENLHLIGKVLSLSKESARRQSRLLDCAKGLPYDRYERRVFIFQIAMQGSLEALDELVISMQALSCHGNGLQGYDKRFYDACPEAKQVPVNEAVMWYEVNRDYLKWNSKGMIFEVHR